MHYEFKHPIGSHNLVYTDGPKITYLDDSCKVGMKFE